MRIDAPSAQRPARLPLIDALRGVAIMAMIVYHFSWDLRFFGFISADVTGDPAWRLFARSIAGTFLALVGVSLVLATRNGLDRGKFLRRLAIVAAAAAAITLVTWLIFPDSFIFFGILHSIAVSSVLGLLFVRAPIILVIAAALLCFAAPAFLAAPAFDAPALLWLGLFTVEPRSNDYVPIFPWFGMVLLGIAAARLALLSGAMRWNIGPRAGNALRPLVWAGRHSLGIYLVHQPILLGLVYLASLVIVPSPQVGQEAYLQSCQSVCVQAGTEAAICSRACSCLVKRTQAEGLWESIVAERLDDAQQERYVALAGECRTAADGP